MSKEPDVKWINMSKAKRTKSILNWKDDNVYPAHSLEAPGLVPYIEKSKYDALVERFGEKTGSNDANK